MSDSDTIVCHLGTVAYEPMWAVQKATQHWIVDGKRNDQPRPHVIFALEHPPVYTLGKSGDEENLLASENELDSIGATFVHIDRGGDITFHGPGQLVVYPLLDLDRIFTDVVKYLRYLESAVIATCADWNVTTDRFEGRTGVWVVPDERGTERKICAMGIKASRWVTMHGLALNISTNLDYFNNIVPCGIDDRDVTSLEQETDGTVDKEDVTRTLLSNILKEFELHGKDLKSTDATSFLSNRVGIDDELIEQLHSL